MYFWRTEGWCAISIVRPPSILPPRPKPIPSLSLALALDPLPLSSPDAAAPPPRRRPHAATPPRRPRLLPNAIWIGAPCSCAHRRHPVVPVARLQPPPPEA